MITSMEKQSVKQLKAQAREKADEELKRRGFKQQPSDRTITVDELMEILIHNHNVIMKEMHIHCHPR